MKISFSEIISYLSQFNIPFRTEEKSDLNTSDKYRFASIKNIIANGFYFVDKNYEDSIMVIKDSIIITNTDRINDVSNTYIYVNNPQLVHYQLAAVNIRSKKNGIHKTAIISSEAVISETAYIGPYCIIEDCIIENHVQLLSNVTVKNGVVIKENTVIEGNSVIGARGMAWIWNDKGERIMQPQIGGVIIEANCIIGTDITIVRGSLNENTQIGNNTIIAHGTKIGHGTIIGDYVHIANNVSLAGNVNIGHRTFLGSASVVSSNVIIASNCIVGAGAVVSKSMDQEFATIVGVPAKVIKIDNFKEKSKGVPKPFKK
jgi:UDP-3-O-[3-hydroxymyristoyl] glucosamine N-acyltransferase